MTTETSHADGYPETNAEVIEKALYCLKHGATESVENWLDLLRTRLSNGKSPAPELASEAADSGAHPARESIVDARAALRNETSSKVNRAGALTFEVTEQMDADASVAEKFDAWYASKWPDVHKAIHSEDEPVADEAIDAYNDMLLGWKAAFASIARSPAMAAEAVFSAGTCHCHGVSAAHGVSCAYANSTPNCRQQRAKQLCPCGTALAHTHHHCAAPVIWRMYEKADALPYTTAAARDILAERHRQIHHEGMTPDRDDRYTEAELSRAAASYVLSACGFSNAITLDFWPWSTDWWKPTTPRRNLVKAAALILAEIEHIDRVAGGAGGKA
ncbi:hypothetical protein HT749_17380 [Burkholderia cepacia]|uniref:hypothetical protein n=1 Tax=Burkholderia cepacia TaxID=292 RepID=UPI00157B2C4D|nr:hypothetical protein [Burkholderia cepacia]NTX45177.1 hypothetical protein [Burkholderia cepacia]